MLQTGEIYTDAGGGFYACPPSPAAGPDDLAGLKLSPLLVVLPGQQTYGRTAGLAGPERAQTLVSKANYRGLRVTGA